jgi:6-phosphogluconate dehydrogenase
MHAVAAPRPYGGSEEPLPRPGVLTGSLRSRNQGNMRIGVIGLGRMGMNLSLRAVETGHDVVGWAPSTTAGTQDGVQIVATLDELVAGLPSPRVVLVYVPHGKPTDEVCERLLRTLAAGDVVIDGGNSHWRDSQRRFRAFEAENVEFIDAGTSGGVSGARSGPCFMVGGTEAAFRIVEPLLKDLAQDEQAVLRVGPPGTGHFAKLVHNAIEFGMVQAIAEGVEMLQRSEYQIDLPALMQNWNHGSVVRSWLIEIMGRALAENPDESELSPYVEDTGEVKWILEWALGEDIPTPVTAAAQSQLMQYRDLDSAAAKAVALLRHGYGRHPVHLRSEGFRGH